MNKCMELVMRGVFAAIAVIGYGILATFEWVSDWWRKMK